MNTSDVSAVQEENRRLKSELAVEKKLLENRVLIAEEKAKALLDQYSSTVAPNQIRNNLLREALDDPLPSRLAAPYCFDKPLASSYSSSYNCEPYKYDSNKYLDSYQQETRYGEQKYISANIDLYRHEEPTRMRISQDLGPIYRSSATPVYETREMPSYQLDRSYVHSDYGVPRESFPAYNSVSYIHRPVLENDLDRSRPTTRIYEAENKPRARVSNKMKHSAFSSGEDYLSRVSQVYPTRENSLNTSSDRASLRRKAVKESSPYRSRPGETFLSQFKQKLQTINS